MATLNKVFLIGNVGRDPDVRAVGNSKVASFSLATAMRYKDRNGSVVEETEWHNIVVFGPSAEYVEQNVLKGTQLHVEGRLRYRKYTDRNGETKYVTEIVASSIQNLSPRRGDSARADAGDTQDSYENPPDMPF